MTVRIYVRASTKDQDAERALDDLRKFALTIKDDVKEYVENESGTKLDRPVLNRLLDVDCVCSAGTILLRAQVI